jgi:putative transcriptional regulator
MLHSKNKRLHRPLKILQDAFLRSFYLYPLMHITPGNLFTASASMDDPHFIGADIFIAEYNEQGAMGFVINKIFERPFNALTEFAGSPGFPLYTGGPVDNEHLFFLHRRNDLIPGGTLVAGEVYLGGDFKQAIAYINDKTLGEANIKIFIGYCGWDRGELEAEIEEGSWILKNNAGDIF